MNKLLIPTGGMPFEGDDLLFLQEGPREAFGILSNFFSSWTGINDHSCILRGVNLSAGSGNITYSNGNVYIAGEPCVLPGGVAVGAEGNEDQWWIELETFADPAGTQIFADAVSKDTYQIRRAKVTNSPTIPSGGAMRFDLLDYYKVINVWVPSTVLPNFNVGEPIQVRKNAGIISFKGALTARDECPNHAPAFTLPEYLRPTHTRIYAISSGTNKPPLWLTVQADGVVKVSNVDGITDIPFTGNIFLDAVHYVVN